MILTCPTCLRIYSTKDLGLEPGVKIPCECGNSIMVPDRPDDPKTPETWDRAGEGVFYGVVTSLPFAYLTRNVAKTVSDLTGLLPSVTTALSFMIGFIIGAVLDQRVLNLVLGKK